MSNASPLQQSFNDTYITATEIATEVGVSRPSVLRARTHQILPDAISVGRDRVYIWERAKVRPHIDKWKAQLQIKKGALA